MTVELSFKVLSVHTRCLSAPLDTPLRNAFGSIAHRPALLVRVGINGAEGLGEVFSNFPAFGNLHKARIIDELLGPLIVGKTFADPPAMMDALERATHRIALQSGEPGPFAHAVAGLDVAVWDALARRASEPLWRLLSDDGTPFPVAAYASGIDGADVAALVPPLRDEGWRAFKLKIGFGEDADRTALDGLAKSAGPGARLMVDANQAWTFNEAERRISHLARSHLAWIEEPIAADRPSEEWQHLTSIGPRLAAGENLRGKDAFQAALDAGVAVIQPDAIKWGGLSGAREVARLCRQHQVLWAPHYLAGGVGLAATAHLAVAQRASYLEMDVNPNPLRDGLLGDALTIEDGFVALADRPGHGATPDTELVDRYTIA